MGAKLREKNGFYWLVVHHKGRRRWKKLGTDKRTAMKAVHKANAKLALGEFSMSGEGDQTVKDALEQWHKDYRPTFSASFAQTADINIKRHLVPFFGSMRLADVDERALLRFIDSKTVGVKKPLKASTLLNILSVLRRVMALAVERGDIQKNPCQNLGRLLRKVERQLSDEVGQVNSWSREEVATLLEIARKTEPRFYPLLAFLLSTGCRKGEALGVKWTDVDFTEGRIHVRRALVRGQLGTPKSGKARFVVLSPSLAETLSELLAERRRDTLSGRWSEVPELVFCSQAGGPLEERNVTRSWDRLRRKAQKKGVRPLRLHDARHTYASLALASGKSVRWVAAQLGHANPELTLRVYAHALREEETDLSFLDFSASGSTKRHPRGTEAKRAPRTKAPPRASARGGFGSLEHETGFASQRCWRLARRARLGRKPATVTRACFACSCPPYSRPPHRRPLPPTLAA